MAKEDATRNALAFGRALALEYQYYVCISPVSSSAFWTQRNELKGFVIPQSYISRR
jgi:hypothetical protein